METGANGAFCAILRSDLFRAGMGHRELRRGKAAFQDDYMSFRNEFFDDLVGQRTGFKTPYSEHLIGWGIGWEPLSCSGRS